MGEILRVGEKVETQAVAALARAMRNISFYAADHPLVRLNIEEASDTIRRVLEKKRELVLKIVEGEMVADDEPLFDTTTGVANLVGACLNRGIESLTFFTGLATEEVASLINLLVTEPEEVERQGGAADILSRQGASHISLEKLLAPSGDEEGPADKGHRTYASALDVLRAAARRAREGASPDNGPTNEVVGSLVDSIMFEQAAMLGMVSVKGRDEYTFTHALHICILCLELGCSLGLERSQLEELGVCAMLHDIGKIFIPLPILRKPAALTQKEFDIIQQHPIHGALLLCRHENAPRMAPLVAFEHHLHYDFSGYPKVSKPREPNFYSLLVGPTDVYDALTTDRPYRPALPPQKALEVMHSQAAHFEPRLLARFTEMLGKYPAGSLVRLNDGNLAVVVKTNSRHAAQPFVRVLEFEDETPRLQEKEIDLTARDPSSGQFRLTVEETVDPTTMGLNVSSLLGGNLYCTEQTLESRPESSPTVGGGVE
jgi:HD-GYP domain-containing protein (c-di-GMP phosphodiesterase class II)